MRKEGSKRNVRLPWWSRSSPISPTDSLFYETFQTAKWFCISDRVLEISTGATRQPCSGTCASNCPQATHYFLARIWWKARNSWFLLTMTREASPLSSIRIFWCDSIASLAAISTCPHFDTSPSGVRRVRGWKSFWRACELNQWV